MKIKGKASARARFFIYLNMTKPISQMNKKELKNHINTLGGFCSMTVEMNTAEGAAQGFPKGAVAISGVASSNQLNRNGYIIEPNAFFAAAEKFIENNGTILLQHNSGRAPIGRVTKVDNQSGKVHFSGFIVPDTMDEQSRVSFNSGLFRGVSTGHITEDYVFENKKTKERLDQKAFKELAQKNGYWGTWQNEWVKVVTKLDWVEVSLVSTASNTDAKIDKNAVQLFIEEIAPNNTDTETPTADIDENTDENAVISKCSDNEVSENETNLNEPETNSDTESNGQEAENNSVDNLADVELLSVQLNTHAEILNGLKKLYVQQKEKLDADRKTILNQSKRIEKLENALRAMPKTKVKVFQKSQKSENAHDAIGTALTKANLL